MRGCSGSREGQGHPVTAAPHRQGPGRVPAEHKACGDARGRGDSELQEGHQHCLAERRGGGDPESPHLLAEPRGTRAARDKASPKPTATAQLLPWPGGYGLGPAGWPAAQTHPSLHAKPCHSPRGASAALQWLPSPPGDAIRRQPASPSMCRQQPVWPPPAAGGLGTGCPRVARMSQGQRVRCATCSHGHSQSHWECRGSKAAQMKARARWGAAPSSCSHGTHSQATALQHHGPRECQRRHRTGRAAHGAAMGLQWGHRDMGRPRSSPRDTLVTSRPSP